MLILRLPLHNIIKMCGLLWVRQGLLGTFCHDIIFWSPLWLLENIWVFFLAFFFLFLCSFLPPFFLYLILSFILSPFLSFSLCVFVCFSLSFLHSSSNKIVWQLTPQTIVCVAKRMFLMTEQKSGDYVHIHQIWSCVISTCGACWKCVKIVHALKTIWKERKKAFRMYCVHFHQQKLQCAMDNLFVMWAALLQVQGNHYQHIF